MNGPIRLAHPAFLALSSRRLACSCIVRPPGSQTYFVAASACVSLQPLASKLMNASFPGMIETTL